MLQWSVNITEHSSPEAINHTAILQSFQQHAAPKRTAVGSGQVLLLIQQLLRLDVNGGLCSLLGNVPRVRECGYAIRYNDYSNQGCGDGGERRVHTRRSAISEHKQRFSRESSCKPASTPKTSKKTLYTRQKTAKERRSRLRYARTSESQLQRGSQRLLAVSLHRSHHTHHPVAHYTLTVRTGT